LLLLLPSTYSLMMGVYGGNMPPDDEDADEDDADAEEDAAPDEEDVPVDCAPLVSEEGEDALEVSASEDIDEASDDDADRDVDDWEEARAAPLLKTEDAPLLVGDPVLLVTALVEDEADPGPDDDEVDPPGNAVHASSAMERPARTKRSLSVTGMDSF
jgi:hypothetical protein